MSTYYTIPESVTSRTDIDPELKWVITNLHNKLQIPPEKLPNGIYTFSVSNVATEMGIAATTIYYRFRMLAEMKVLKEIGTKRTSHGLAVIYAADGERLGKLLSGEMTVPRGLLKQVRKKKKPASETDEPPSSETERGPSEADGTSSPAEIRISPADASTQIQYPNSSTQNVPAQSTAYTSSNLIVPSGPPATPSLSAERLGVEIENQKRLAAKYRWPQEFLNQSINELIKNSGR